MRLSNRFRAAFLRWDRLLAISAVALPVAVAIVFGFMWMVEHQYLITYIVASISIGGLLALIRVLARRIEAGRTPSTAEVPAEVHVPPNPDWGADEERAYSVACALIRRRTHEPFPWSDLQTVAIEVVKSVASTSGPSGRGPLDFTVPEALLMIERVTSRVRTDLRTLVPFADTVSIGTIDWLWRHKDWGRLALKAGHGAWRVFRFVKSPPAAILREIDGELAGGHSRFLTAEAMAMSQAILLEEIAKAAVDLYSGRLRFSDSELLEMRLAYGDLDRRRLATPDAPLRISIAGQVSAGKSSIINAIMQEDKAETDAPSTTDRASTYEVQLNGMDCVLLDLPGLDGGSKTRDMVVRQLTESDVIIWAVRANRPAREIDRRITEELARFFLEAPQRRQPPFIPVATCVDTLVEGWPFPEHHLSPEARATIGEAVNTIGEKIGTDAPIPVSLISPEWNVETLRHRLDAVMGEGLMVQRNRARLDGGKRDLSREVVRTGRGLSLGLRTIGRKMLERSTPRSHD